ncbi:hypothetical protein DBR11_14375 [Pedobacter sp. HMWF019]|uniref:OmpA family protein n=1 Tax=Pedobacter sp. HMWF019 TaxID=2056856 RepID=UPI000D348174|nr:OmpA family protein [Pedobacter sp. HMWF019]PTS98627.1 hypothetical protein DBR11_14375 [Pedobacter sp. HMWF019]
MKSKNDFFWPSFTDLMTSLFFIMLVLYVLTYVQLKHKNTVLEEKLKIIETVESNLEPLKRDTMLFNFEPQYNRYKLAFDVKFNTDKSIILSDADLINPDYTRTKITEAGKKLKMVIDDLKLKKEKDPNMRNLSYILVIAGYASKDKYSKSLAHNYDLSYKRALSLWAYWKYNVGIDFESPEYKNLIDLQISGNGWGGVGRLDNEEDNQRFLIQIFPKIANIK